MHESEGLSWYEHWEADRLPELFLPRSKDPYQGVSKRLRCDDAYYIALNVPRNTPRFIIHESRWRITNIDNGDSVTARLVDTGPSARGRLIDVSRAVMRAIGMDPDRDTDKQVEVREDTYFKIPFGLYGEEAT
jgi:hypothetical protein